MFLQILIPIVILLSLTLIIRIKNRRIRRLGNAIPGPPTKPIIGNAYIFFNIPLEDNLRILGELFQKYGNTYRLWLVHNLIIMFCDHKDLEVIMGGMFFINKSESYDNLTPWLNEGLLISKGKKWHGRRKLITPAFHFKTLETYINVFEKQGKVFCDILKKKGNLNTPFELYQDVTRYTLDVISGMFDISNKC